MEYRNTKMYRFLVILTIASVVGLQGWMTLFNNFAVEVGGLSGYQMGVTQSVREIPGFLALLVIYVLLVISEHRLAALSILLLGLGIGLTGYFPSYGGIVVTTLIMSFGFHYYETLNMSLTLQYFNVTTAPLVATRLRSLGAICSILIGVIVYLLSMFMSYKQQFAVIGIVIMLMGGYALMMNPSDASAEPQHKKMVFRKNYWLFYTLTLFAGARRQIFVAFAVFLMVERFAFTIQEVTILFVLNNLINYFLSPYIGKAINHFGERWVLSIEYFFLIAVFLTYAFTTSKMLVAVMYIIDHILFNFAIAIRTFFQKIGDKRDVAPTMAVGFTINHIAAVVIPVLGGIAWMTDYRIPFIAAAILSFVSLMFTQLIPWQLKKKQIHF